MTQAYPWLEKKFAQLNDLSGAMAVLHWDSATMMVSGGGDARAHQLATLGALQQELLTTAEMADKLAAAGEEKLNRWQAANLREMTRRFEQARALPADLLMAATHAGATCERAWRSARAADDFKSLVPHLEKVVAITRDIAAAKADYFSLAPYDALLDQFEPGLRDLMVNNLFAMLADELPDLLSAVIEKEEQAGPPLALPGDLDIAGQRRLAEKLAHSIGFDFDRGRLDESLHPFTGGIPDDVRMTTRYARDHMLGGMLGVIHETGHSLYEQNLPRKWRRQPVGQSMGMGLHESQSLIIEMQAARSDAFIGHFARLARKEFAGKGAVWSKANLARHIRRVGRGLIRVDADEVSYPLHIILRYRLEKALLSGDLKVKELPGAWREGMQQLIGVKPPTDRDGCMQDIHWMDGAFGYFPSYTLGAIAAAQLFQAAGKAEPELEADLARGDFSRLTGWLARNIHAKASYYPDSDSLLRKASGRGFDGAGFVAHLKQRYLRQP